MLEICNGLLGGLVAITSGCAVVEPWAAVICGAIAAPCVVYGEQLLIRFKVDDPASSFSIHGLSGIWGMIFVGLLAKQEYILEAYSENGRTASSATMGLLYGGHGQLLLCQVIAIVVNISWVVFWMIPFFMLLNKLGLLRVPVDAEAVGIDAMQMGQTSKESDLISSAKSVVGMSAIEVSNDQYINFNNGGMAKNEVAQVSSGKQWF
ncbi:hypothetical protein FOA52_015285 [Chlamydomonas sp. UWO 241]|nr:hypothetical protein FOA52_015285 [Chlamydomonas sp. UWO 241]